MTLSSAPLVSRLESFQLLSEFLAVIFQTHLNLMTHALVEIGQLDRAMDVLRNKLCVPSEDGTELGLPQEAWPQLQAAVHSTSDMELRQKLEVHVRVHACIELTLLSFLTIFVYVTGFGKRHHL